MQKITPFFWFDHQAEEAANFYVSLFKNSKINSVARYPDGSPGGPAGSVMTVSFQLEGQDFTALNAGPQYQFTPAVSFVVDCQSQEEVDRFWDALSAGGHEDMCGWLTDRFGVTWQIVPRVLIELLQDKDPAKARRVSDAMLTMRKIDIGKLQEAYASV